MRADQIDENLRKWFKEKWVRFGPDGKIRGACARGSEGEGKPKCLPQAKAHALGKKGRASAAARKRREDPNPERSGKAINVATKKKTSESVMEGNNKILSVQVAELLYELYPELFKKYGDEFLMNLIQEICHTNPDATVSHCAANVMRHIKSKLNETTITKLPKVLYHGGDETITQFNIPPYGAYFSPHVEWAEEYGDKITKARVLAKKIYLLDYKNEVDERIVDALFDRDYNKVAKYIKLLQKHGYDAMQSVTDSEMVVVFPGTPIQVISQEGVAEEQLDEKCWDTHKQVGMKKKGGKLVPNCVPKESVAEEQLDEKWSEKYKKSINCSNPKGFSQRAHCQGRKKNESIENMDLEKQKYIQSAKDVLKGADFDHLVRIRNLNPEILKKFVSYAWEKVNSGEYKLNRPNLEEQKCPHCNGPMFEETMMNEKKDACYYKVKSRYKVWPSAYASGALVQCRKKGAKNWGTKSESIADTLNELSPETLASYKKKAGAEASALDKAAFAGAPDAKEKLAKAHKRFKGIVQATKKEFSKTNETNGHELDVEITFVLYADGKPVARFPTRNQAKEMAEALYAKFPNKRIEIKIKKLPKTVYETIGTVEEVASETTPKAKKTVVKQTTKPQEKTLTIYKQALALAQTLDQNEKNKLIMLLKKQLRLK